MRSDTAIQRAGEARAGLRRPRVDRDRRPVQPVHGPGTAEEIKTFCSSTYGVTFPLLAKTEVNGPDRHPLFAELTKIADAAGDAGDVQWNFEKFLLAPGGVVVRRFRPRTEPDAPEVVEAIEAVLPR